MTYFFNNLINQIDGIVVLFYHLRWISRSVFASNNLNIEIHYTSRIFSNKSFEDRNERINFQNHFPGGTNAYNTYG